MIKSIASSLGALAHSSGSALVGYIQGGTNSMPRTVQDKLRELSVTPQDFMTNDQILNVAARLGTTDVSDAIQKALTHLNSIGGGFLFLPPGKYRKADTSNTLVGYSNMIIWGCGDASEIFHDDTDINPRKDLITLAGTTSVTLSNFKISGTYLTYPNQTNQSQGIVGADVERLRIENVTLNNLRFMAIAMRNVTDAKVTGCSLDTIARDGIRFVDSQDIVVTDNYLKYIGDNPIAIHTDNDTAGPLMSGGYVVTNNIIEQSAFSAFLGAKKLTYTNNIHLRCTGGVSVTYDTSAEGDTPQYAINISDNQFIDTWATYGATKIAPINLNGVKRNAGSGTTIPGYPDVATGIVLEPYGYFDVNNVTGSNAQNPGASDIIVRGNIIKRTLGLTGAYSNYGYGQRFSPNTDDGFYDPAVTDGDLVLYGIDIRGSISSLAIENNIFEGLSAASGSCAIHVFELTAVDNTHNISNLSILNNKFTDCPRGAIVFVHANPTTNIVTISGNSFNCDPYYRNPDRVAGNKWASSNVCQALNLANVNGVILDDNTFRNCSFTGYNSSRMTAKGNKIFSDFVGKGFNANNRGVGVAGDAGAGFLTIKIQGDPTLAAYDSIVDTMPVIASSAMPASGYYLPGHFVENTNFTHLGTSPDKYTILGWSRATVGNAHVLNTDWFEVRCPTGV